MIDKPEVYKKQPLNLLTKRIDEVDLGRKDPQSIEMEKAILAAIMIDKDGIDVATEILKPESFYLPSHQKIFEAAIKIADRLEPIDIAILAEQLSKDGALEMCGGAQYLIEITNTIASSSNLEFHCRIVAQKYIQRELIRLSHETIRDAYTPTKDVFDVIDKIENQISGLFSDSVVDPMDGVELFDECLEYVAELKANPKDGLHGLNTGISELNDITGGWRNGDLIIIAGRPGMGKTAVAISQLTSHDGVSAFFSLEMPSKQIGYRLMSGESRIPYSKIEKGEISDDELSKLISARSVFEKIIIDDSHSITINILKRKVRKIKRANPDLKLVVIDYLQLLQPSEKKGNREQEISQISKGLKIIAKEFGLPVIALAQLSRSVESRTDKRPMLSDLRECLSIETSKIYTMAGLKKNEEIDGEILSLGESNKIEERNSLNIPKERNKVFRLLTRTGRYIDCTESHPILTTSGYKKLKDITRLDSIALAKNWSNSESFYVRESKFIGWMIGNGSMTGYGSPSFITRDEEISVKFVNFIEDRFGFRPKFHPDKRSKVFQWDLTHSKTGNRTKEGNVARKWLKENDLWGKTAKYKVIPSWFMEKADNQSIYELIQGLWETDGTISVGKSTVFKYATTSIDLAHQLMYLLAKVGVIANIDKGRMSEKATTKCYSVSMSSNSAKSLFKDRIKLDGYKGGILNSTIEKSRQSYHLSKLNRDTTLEIESIAKECGIRVQIHGNRRLTTKVLSEIIEQIPEKMERYRWLLSDGIFWDSVNSISEIGEVDIFDRSVPGTNNFIVNGIIVHNSGAIEQDADMVIFAYRPEYYDKDAKDENGDSLQGVAEMIIAKNRSGGTGVAKAKFVGELMKMENFKEETISLIPPSSNYRAITSTPDFEKSFLGETDDF